VGVQPAAKPPRRRFLPAAAGIVLFVLGAVFGLLSYESVSKLWGDQDSPVWIYVVYGAVAFALALACFCAAVQSLRRSAGVNSSSPRVECSAEREAGEAEDDRVANNANRAQPEHVGERPHQTDQA